MSTQGYVLGPTEGEHLIRNAGTIVIKVDPRLLLALASGCVASKASRTVIAI